MQRLVLTLNLAGNTSNAAWRKLDTRMYALGVLTQFCGMTEAEVKNLVADAFNEAKSRKIHAYIYVWNVVGRKPVKKPE